MQEKMFKSKLMMKIRTTMKKLILIKNVGKLEGLFSTMSHSWQGMIKDFWKVWKKENLLKILALN